MTSLQEMAKQVYEKISDKSLEFGCIVISPVNCHIIIGKKFDEEGNIYAYVAKENTLSGGHRDGHLSLDKSKLDSIHETIGHPVRIGDVLEYLSTKIKDRHLPEFLETRPQDKLSQPIPLDPTEERRPVLEFLISII